MGVIDGDCKDMDDYDEGYLDELEEETDEGATLEDIKYVWEDIQNYYKLKQEYDNAVELVKSCDLENDDPKYEDDFGDRTTKCLTEQQIKLAEVKRKLKSELNDDCGVDADSILTNET